MRSDILEKKILGIRVCRGKIYFFFFGIKGEIRDKPIAGGANYVGALRGRWGRHELPFAAPAAPACVHATDRRAAGRTRGTFINLISLTSSFASDINTDPVYPIASFVFSILATNNLKFLFMLLGFASGRIWRIWCFDYLKILLSPLKLVRRLRLQI